MGNALSILIPDTPGGNALGILIPDTPGGNALSLRYWILSREMHLVY